MAREHDIETLPKWARKRLLALEQRVADLQRSEMLLRDESMLIRWLERLIYEGIGENRPIFQIESLVKHNAWPIRKAIRHFITHSRRVA